MIEKQHCKDPSVTKHRLLVICWCIVLVM